MKKSIVYLIVLFFAIGIVACNSRIPQLEFIGIRAANPDDTIPFPTKVFPYYILKFTSDMDLDKYDPKTAQLYLHASAKKQNFVYSDLIQENDEREEGGINTVFMRLVEQKKGKYYYDAAFYFTPSEWKQEDINDSIYCKVFFVRFLSFITKYSGEMCIPKDSLNMLFK